MGTRLVKGRPGQLLLVGWACADSRTRDKLTEEYMAIICHREQDRNELLGVLHAVSVPKGGSQKHRVPLQTDALFQQALENHCTEAILLCTFAQVPGGALELLVLTEGQLYEFAVHFEYYALLDDDPDEGADGDMDDEDGDDAPTVNCRPAMPDTGKTELMSTIGQSDQAALEDTSAGANFSALTK